MKPAVKSGSRIGYGYTPLSTWVDMLARCGFLLVLLSKADRYRPVCILCIPLGLDFYVPVVFQSAVMLSGHEKLLESVRICRSEARRTHRPRSGVVRCLDSMIDEIDAVAELITAKPDYFHDKGSAPNRG
jgi:hypothetical protein